MNLPIPSFTKSLLLPLLLAATCWSGGLSLAEESTEKKLVLAAKGTEPAPIIVTREASPRTRKAADELAAYIQKVSGALPVIIEGEPSPVPTKAIWVGYQPKLKTLFPNLDFNFQNPEEILISANENHLVIVGRDRWNPEQSTDARIAKKVIKDLQQEYGSVNAIYTFIQQYLNVRWLWPGDIGEDIIKSDTIAFAPFEYRYHPQFLARSGLFRLSEIGDGRGQSHDWARLQRLQLDSLPWTGGHAFTDWWGKFHESHPEYFALQPDGTRNAYPYPNAVMIKICSATPAVWDRWMEDVKEQLQKNPGQIAFNASPNDGYFSGHCVCELCEAWDDPKGEKYTYNWKGSNKEGVSFSDRYVRFWNHLSEKLKAEYPDKPYYINALAYGNSRAAPLAVAPADNIIMTGIFNVFFKEKSFTDKMTRYMLDWSKLAPFVFRPNLWQQVGRAGLPELSLKQTVNVFRLLADNHCIGIWLDSLWEHWATQGPQYYLMAQLSWNPHADGQAILDDYYQRGFGPAAGEVAEYWNLMSGASDATVTRFGTPDGSYSFYENLEPAMAEIYTPEFFAKCEALLKTAADKTANSPEIYGQRVDFVQCGLTFTRLMMDQIINMKKVAVSKGGDTEALARAEEDWNKIMELNKTHPYAFNFSFVQSSMKRKIFTKKMPGSMEYFKFIENSEAGKKGPDSHATSNANDLDLE